MFPLARLTHSTRWCLAVVLFAGMAAVPAMAERSHRGPVSSSRSLRGGQRTFVPGRVGEGFRLRQGSKHKGSLGRSLRRDSKHSGSLAQALRHSAEHKGSSFKGRQVTRKSPARKSGGSHRGSLSKRQDRGHGGTLLQRKLFGRLDFGSLQGRHSGSQRSKIHKSRRSVTIFLPQPYYPQQRRHYSYERRSYGFYPYSTPLYSGYYYDRGIDAYERGYQKGRRDVELREAIERREQAVYSSFDNLMAEGLYEFRVGRYRKAANLFLAAAELNHGDAASRLHAAHALFAVGDYRAAVVVLRRAFQLQPKIVALTYDIEDAYGDDDDFEDHLEELEDAAEDNRRDVSLWVLLGYVRAYSDDRDDAYEALVHALRLDPRDELANRLARATKGGVLNW